MNYALKLADEPQQTVTADTFDVVPPLLVFSNYNTTESRLNAVAAWPVDKVVSIIPVPTTPAA